MRQKSALNPMVQVQEHICCLQVQVGDLVEMEMRKTAGEVVQHSLALVAARIAPAASAGPVF